MKTTKKNATKLALAKSEEVKQGITLATASIATINAAVDAAASVPAPSGIGTTANITSEETNIPAAGVPAPAKPRQTATSQEAANAVIYDDLKVSAFRQKVAAKWAAPAWSGAAALRATLAATGRYSEEQITAMISAAGRKSDEDLSAKQPTINEVVDYINKNYANEFKQLCGCAVPAAGDVRVWSYTNISVLTITETSEESDYISCCAVPAGASASAIVAAVLSVRFLVDVRQRIGKAKYIAKKEIIANVQNIARRANRLGVSAEVLCRYVRLALPAVAVSDNKEIKQLRKNLANIRKQIMNTECDLSGYGLRCIECTDGFVFDPELPKTGVPAKARKLWSDYTKLKSQRNRLITLLETACGAC